MFESSSSSATKIYKDFKDASVLSKVARKEQDLKNHRKRRLEASKSSLIDDFQDNEKSLKIFINNIVFKD